MLETAAGSNGDDMSARQIGIVTGCNLCRHSKRRCMSDVGRLSMGAIRIGIDKDDFANARHGREQKSRGRANLTCPDDAYFSRHHSTPIIGQMVAENRISSSRPATLTASPTFANRPVVNAPVA
ncbi:Uncharacterised protein [Agrobacterium tumefaciens]|nr:Uncharacterised protein [Agrobacterium tumefaciens]